MKLRTIKDIDIAGKKVLVRVDYNVSLLDGFRIGDDLRIRQSLPTIKYLLKKNCAVLLVAHLGRPGGKENPKFSLKPVRDYLQRLLMSTLGIRAVFTKDYIDGPGKKFIQQIKPGSVSLLENIRFYPGEAKNDKSFAKKLASLADVYVNDAFGVSHRVHASTIGVTKFLPSVAGLLLEKEIKIISRAVSRPKRPFVVIIGGAKAKTKIPLIVSLIDRVDILLIDGGVGNTFLKARGFKMGKSLVDKEMVGEARRLFKKARHSKTQIELADDVVVGNLGKGVYKGVVSVDKIPKNLEALDIGPKTEVKFGRVIEKAKTIIWNGPMGVFERPEFARGTNFIYQAIAANRDSLSIVGGGETLAALPKEEYLETIDHVSTGGGAMLEFIEKGMLAGIEALEKSRKSRIPLC